MSQVLTDLRYAETYWGLPKVPYTAIQVGISSIDTSGLDEWDLDTQIIERHRPNRKTPLRLSYDNA